MQDGPDQAVHWRIEQFLYKEASLLDAWRLEEWLALFAEDAVYVVPATGGATSDDLGLALITDDHARLVGRVRRLLSRHAHANNPRPRTRHLLTNVRAESNADENAPLCALANFIIYSMRYRQTNVFMGEYRYRLRLIADGEFRIVEKRATLDMETLDPAGGKINIVI